jgi:hypothetical protein
MAARRRVQGFSFAVLAALLGGCASAPSRFYTLAATAAPDAGAATAVAVLVGPVFVPPAVDRPEFVVEVAPNQVAVDEFNRWAAPLGDAIARTIAGDLSAQLGSPDVAVAPLPNFRADYRVSITIQRFDSTPGVSAAVDAVWTVNDIAKASSRSGRTSARETVDGPGFDALAAAHSRALAAVSADIAAAIRAAAAH